MRTEKDTENEIVLAIAAHPDDIDIVAGGTIAKWIAEGAQVIYCIVSDGDAGSSDPTISKSQIASLRRKEQEGAASILGVKDLYFLGWPDSRIQPSLDLRLEIAKLIRRVKPHKILTHAPIYNLGSIRFSHPDHLAVGQSVLAATFPDARNPNAFIETDLTELVPHAVDTVWMIGAPDPNIFVDITELLEKKILAVNCHQSQLGDFGNVEVFFQDWGREIAIAAGLPDNRFAEAFYKMETQ